MESKNVLVTGASRGIGRAAAFRFAKGGYHVFLNCCTSVDELNEVRRGIEEVYQGSCEDPIL